MADLIKTPVSELQEVMVYMGIAPIYELVHSQQGTHQNVFIYRVTCGPRMCRGAGRSKKAAKHAAALAMLNQVEPDRPASPAVDVQRNRYLEEVREAVRNIPQVPVAAPQPQEAPVAVPRGAPVVAPPEREEEAAEAHPEAEAQPAGVRPAEAQPEAEAQAPSRPESPDGNEEVAQMLDEWAYRVTNTELTPITLNQLMNEFDGMLRRWGFSVDREVGMANRGGLTAAWTVNTVPPIKVGTVGPCMIANCKWLMLWLAENLILLYHHQPWAVNGEVEE